MPLANGNSTIKATNTSSPAALFGVTGNKDTVQVNSNQLGMGIIGDANFHLNGTRDLHNACSLVCMKQKAVCPQQVRAGQLSTMGQLYTWSIPSERY